MTTAELRQAITDAVTKAVHAFDARFERRVNELHDQVARLEAADAARASRVQQLVQKRGPATSLEDFDPATVERVFRVLAEQATTEGERGELAAQLIKFRKSQGLRVELPS